MGGGKLTKEHALKIAQKLRGIVTKGKAHDICAVYFDGKLEKSFGIRHGSRKDQSHEHIVNCLGVNRMFAKELAQCTKSSDDYFEKIGLK